MPGHRIGYVRVSSFDQNPERQVVVQALRNAGNADDSLLPHLSPLGWEHINLAGDYNWRQNKQVEQSDFRPLPPLNRPYRTIFPFREVTLIRTRSGFLLPLPAGEIHE